MSEFRTRAGFNAWVNRQLYEVVAGIPDEGYRRESGAFFGSIHRTLNHILVVDRVWTDRIEGRDRGIRSLDQILYEDFGGLRAAQEAEDAALIALVERLDEAALERPTVYRSLLGHGPDQMKTRHILTTLFNHQTHHRGQVHCLLTQQGVTVPPLDVVHYLREVGELTPA